MLYAFKNQSIDFSNPRRILVALSYLLPQKLTIYRQFFLYLKRLKKLRCVCPGQGGVCRSTLHIYLKPGLIAQVAEASEIDRDRISLANCFSKRDLRLQQIAMLFMAELKSDGIMGQLYAESLSQVLVIHLLRHYSTFTHSITSENRSLTRTQLQQAIDYIHTHLDRDLSLVEIAGIVNISPTYLASLFKRATGISPHQ